METPASGKRQWPVTYGIRTEVNVQLAVESQMLPDSANNPYTFRAEYL